MTDNLPNKMHLQLLLLFIVKEHNILIQLYHTYILLCGTHLPPFSKSNLYLNTYNQTIPDFTSNHVILKFFFFQVGYNRALRTKIIPHA